MKSVAIIYFSRGGHTAKIAQHMATTLTAAQHQCELINVSETTEIDWDKYHVIAFGAPVLYGTYDKKVFEFIRRYQDELAAKENSFFCVNVVARNPEKRTLENNKYFQKFLSLSPWQPQSAKIIAGIVNYPAWPWYDRLMIQLIMKMTDGPTDPKAVIDYTDWDDVADYALSLVN